MKYVQHPNHTHNLGAPPGWDHSKVHCGSLSICAMTDRGYPLMESAWELEGNEAILLAMGLGQIRLAVYSQQHPPVSMVAVQTKTDRQMVISGLHTALHQLADYASGMGLETKVKAAPGRKVTVSLAGGYAATPGPGPRQDRAAVLQQRLQQMVREITREGFIINTDDLQVLEGMDFGPADGPFA